MGAILFYKIFMMDKEKIKMKEKVLIKSFVSQGAKKFFIGVIVLMLAIALVFLFLGFHIGKDEWASYKLSLSSYYSNGLRFYKCPYCGTRNSGDAMKQHLLSLHSNQASVFQYAYWAFILHWLFIFNAGIFCLIYFLLSRCNITVTDKNIKGRTLGGKNVVLPIHMVSAYGTRKFCSAIAIATSSGFIHFSFIGNYKEIGNVLHNLINQRQDATKFTANNSIESHNDLDDLKKLKELLDNGIISQEEFNVKKKQLLGL